MAYINKKHITYVAIAAIWLLSTNAYADHHRGKRLDRMAEKLSLSDEQKSSIRQIFDAARNNCESIDSRKEHKKCMRSQKEDVHKNISAILSDDQKEKFNEMKEKRKKKSRDCDKG